MSTALTLQNTAHENLRSFAFVCVFVLVYAPGLPAEPVFFSEIKAWNGLVSGGVFMITV